MKSIDDALELRGRIFGAFESAELASTPKEIERLMTFVVVGAGPTGVEMAGQIAELVAPHACARLPHGSTRAGRASSCSTPPRHVLPSFGEHLGAKAAEQAHAASGVEVQLGAKVADVDATGIEVEDADGARRRIESVSKVWAAGVQASALGAQLAEQSGAELDRAGSRRRSTTTSPCRATPRSSSSATWSRSRATRVSRRSPSRARATPPSRSSAGSPARSPQEPFEYHDKGSMATISRFSAVASIGRLRFSGFIAWVLWLADPPRLHHRLQAPRSPRCCTGRSASSAGAAPSAPSPSSRSSPRTRSSSCGEALRALAPHGAGRHARPPAGGPGAEERRRTSASCSDARPAAPCPIGGRVLAVGCRHAAGLPHPPSARSPTACASSSPRPHRPQRHREPLGRRRLAPRDAGRTGFAHLFEHLMFQGSRNVASGEHFAPADGRGRPAQRDDVVRPHQLLRDRAQGRLELALWLEADRHGHLLDAVTQENLDNQRDVVKEEKRQRYDNVPYGNALIDVYAAVFPEGHPYHHPTIGSMEDLDAASLEDVHAFFRALLRAQQHRPDPRRRPHPGGGVRRCRALLRRPAGLGRAAARRPPAARRRSRSRCGSTASRTCPTTGSTSPSGCRSTTPTSTSPARSPSTSSAAWRRSRLVRGSCAREQAANAAQAARMGFVDGVSLGLHRPRRRRRRRPRRRSRPRVVEELERLRRARARPRSSWSPSLAADRALLAARPGQPGGAGRPDQPPRAAARRPGSTSTPSSTGSRAIDRRAGRAAAARPGCARDSRAVVAYLVDDATDAAGPRATPHERRRPPRRRPAASRGRSPSRSAHAAANGIALLTYDVPGQYVVSVRLVAARSRCAPSRASERASRRSWRALLDEGTAQHTSEEFAELLERKGIALGAGMADAGLSVDLDVAKRHLEPALDLLRQTLTEPAFPQAEVARHVTHPARRDRAGAGDRARTAPRSSSLATFFDARRPGLAGPPAAPARRSSAITRDDVVDVPRRARRPAGVPPSSSPATSPASTWPALARGGPRRLVDDARQARDRARSRRGTGRRRAPASCSSTGPARCRPSSSSAAPGPGPPRRRRLGALPGAGLRARRLAERPRRRGAARGEGLHLRHPLELPAPAPRRAVPHRGLGARRLDGGVGAAPARASSTAAREGFTDERDPRRASTSSARPRRAATPPPTPSPTRRRRWRSRGCRTTSPRATCAPWPTSTARRSTRPTAGSPRGSGPSSWSATPRPWCRHSRPGRRAGEHGCPLSTPARDRS